MISNITAGADGRKADLTPPDYLTAALKRLRERTRKS